MMLLSKYNQIIRNAAGLVGSKVDFARFPPELSKRKEIFEKLPSVAAYQRVSSTKQSIHTITQYQLSFNYAILKSFIYIDCTMQEVIAFLRQLKDAGLLDFNFVKACLLNTNDVSNDLVSWKSVSMFLLMAKEALRSKQICVDESINNELEAKYEALFLSNQLESLQEEREKTQQLLNTLQRENHNLLAEIEILRDQMSSSSLNGSQESPHALQLLEKYRQELALEQTRNAVLEKEINVLRRQTQDGVTLKEISFQAKYTQLDND